MQYGEYLPKFDKNAMDWFILPTLREDTLYEELRDLDLCVGYKCIDVELPAFKDCFAVQ